MTLLVGGVRSSVLDSFKPYLHDRLADGMRNATVLHTEIAERGYTGGYVTLRRYLRPLRHIEAAAAAAPGTAGGAAGRWLDHRSPGTPRPGRR